MKKNYYFKFIENLYCNAKEAGWKIFYDRESDSLFWTVKPVPADDKLAKVSSEISFFLGKGGGVNGLIIRPFQRNFVSHNQEVEKVSSFFTKKDGQDILSIPAGKRKESESLVATLSATIGKSIYRDAAEAEHPLKDLEYFLSSTSSRVG